MKDRKSKMRRNKVKNKKTQELGETRRKLRDKGLKNRKKFNRRKGKKKKKRKKSSCKKKKKKLKRQKKNV